MDRYRYECTTCPFKTSDAAIARSHETYLERHPEGWLGHGETHTMRDRETAMIRIVTTGTVTTHQALDDERTLCGKRWTLELEPGIGRVGCLMCKRNARTVPTALRQMAAARPIAAGDFRRGGDVALSDGRTGHVVGYDGDAVLVQTRGVSAAERPIVRALRADR